MAKAHLIAGLDIGTNTVRLLVVQKKPAESDLEVLDQEEEPASGVRKGVVVNFEQAARAGVHPIHQGGRPSKQAHLPRSARGCRDSLQHEISNCQSLQPGFSHRLLARPEVTIVSQFDRIGRQ